jgi:hypothetical protein
VRIDQKLAADPSNHRSVPRQQHLERRFVAMLDESLQNLPVRHPQERSILEDTSDVE